MNIVREDQSYRFTYRPGHLMRLDTEGLDSYGKYMLLRSLITISEAAEGYLIGAENYLLEPELLYTTGGGTSPDHIRILFYPDVRRKRFQNKLLQFTDRISKNSSREEREVLQQFMELIGKGEINKEKMFLDKKILRIENRSFGKAG